ncbi:MAG: signal recognition particle protein [Candidatus Eremiobacteraeota bacterium]|nr:signal recognition particle protein [Candidatus Eremiobacteraeota bacterium]
MFESLSERISGVIKKLRGRGKLTEADVKEALREVRRAMLEADVSLPVVRDFVKKVEERAIGEELWKSLTPGQLVVKHVRDELTELMGGDTSEIGYAEEGPTVIMLVGLNGSGKTTSSGKLANFLKKNGKKPLLAATDVYRPAAIKQLEILGKQIGVPVFAMGDKTDPVNISKAAVAHAEREGLDVVVVDTAGRLTLNEELMAELQKTHEALSPHECLLVVDAMTGQDAVNIAEQFSQRIKVTGIVMTKLDGDARGGAALSVRHVTGSPIKFVGMGEKISALELFHPDRMASRILGMGDVLGLIEKAEQAMDEEEAALLEKKIREDNFTLNDFLGQMQQIKKLGPLQDIIKMIPGMGGNAALKDLQVDEKRFSRMEAIIRSMTMEERRHPDILNASRKKRVAKGSGNEVSEVNQLLKQFEMLRKMMRQLTGGGGPGGGKKNKKKNKKGRRKIKGIPFRLPFK